MKEIRDILDTLKTQIHHSECKFHSKHITEEQHHKEIDHFSDQAMLQIKKVVEGKRKVVRTNPYPDEKGMEYNQAISDIAKLFDTKEG